MDKVRSGHHTCAPTAEVCGCMRDWVCVCVCNKLQQALRAIYEGGDAMPPAARLGASANASKCNFRL